jgi:O-antigen ligase
VIAALVVVMFTASLPISFSGWGLRELSAGTVLGAIGMPASIAVTAAFAIGVLSIVVMFVFAAVSLLMRPPRRSVAAQPQSDGASLVQHFRSWDALFIAGSALFCAVFMFFQVRVPRPHGDLTVNPADIAAITGLAVLGYFVLTRRIPFPLPRFITAALIVISGILAAGLLSAYWQGHLGSWALINRGVGWFIILGYVAIGASAVAIGGEALRVLILKIMVLASSAVCLIQLAAMAYSYLVARIPSDIFPFPLEGFVNNQNAFSFQLCMVLIILIAMSRVQKPLLQASFARFAFLLLTVAIYYTKSRSGLIVLSLLILSMLALSTTRFVSDPVTRRRLRIDAACMVAALLIAVALPYMIYAAIDALGNPGTGLLSRLSAPDSLGVKITHASSGAERHLIFTQSWELWRAHPWFGAGLGSFVEWRVATGQAPQVIHSIPMWLMAEMGLVGLAVMIAASLFVAIKSWRTAMVESPRWGLALFGVLACIAIDGLAHDLFFQRIFWFLLGVLCVVPPAEPVSQATESWGMTASTGRAVPSPAP